METWTWITEDWSENISSLFTLLETTGTNWYLQRNVSMNLVNGPNYTNAEHVLYSVLRCVVPGLSTGEQSSLESFSSISSGSQLTRRDSNMLTTVCCQVGCRKSDLTFLCWEPPPLFFSFIHSCDQNDCFLPSGLTDCKSESSFKRWSPLCV